jgi:Macrocin-O-methyltransferase (TylF)
MDTVNTIENIRKHNLTYLSVKRLKSIADTCLEIENSKLPGMFIEAGCALGGSAILIASMMSAERRFEIYDVFKMIPPPTLSDTPECHRRYRTIASGKSSGIGGDCYYGYQDNLLKTVQENFQLFGFDTQAINMRFFPGLLGDTLNVNLPVAFAHIDVDWHDPVRICLERIFPHLIIGGSIIVDDYRDWGGCRKAVDQYLQNATGHILRNELSDSLKITRLT